MTPAKYREVRKYVRKEVTNDVVAMAASHMRMKLLSSSRNFMSFRVRLNFWSWSEKMTVSIGMVDDCCIVDVTSVCVLMTQIADWGKNERNVRKLFEEIDKILGSDCEYTRCLLCGECDYLLVGIPEGNCPECGHAYSLGDRAKKQGTTMKDAIVLALGITVAEVVLVMLIDLFNVGHLLPGMLHGIGGVAFLLWINLCSISGIVGLQHLLKRYIRRN